ncbi:Rieske (2Fe-2S) protein [Streptomyces sp. NPDC007355]|uniref:Rieske (2Fe-2S) protein n=1 Tax=Streptomyces sp. NPDC007355 TaxID=3364778 RepID=UPI003699E59D
MHEQPARPQPDPSVAELPSATVATGPTRRTALTGLALTAAAVTGCSRYGDNTTPDARAQPPTTSDSSTPSQPAPSTNSPAASSNGGGTAPPVAALASTTDIPVGGGKIFPEEKLVLTQPQPGQFKAFSAICTHAGCTVATITSGTINCPCHGSKFHLADGTVAKGPATRPLTETPITVAGTTITRA